MFVHKHVILYMKKLIKEGVRMSSNNETRHNIRIYEEDFEKLRWLKFHTKDTYINIVSQAINNEYERIQKNNK